MGLDSELNCGVDNPRGGAAITYVEVDYGTGIELDEDTGTAIA